MDLTKYYTEEDIFPKRFARYEERNFGILFYDLDNKDSYDSNHAVIYRDKITDLHAVLEEIKNFYHSIGRKAIIYQSMLDNNYFEEIKEQLMVAGYESWSEEQRYMLPLEKNRIVPNECIEVRQEYLWKEEMTQIFLEAEEPWEIDVAKKSIGSDDEWCFTAYLDGTPIGITYGHVTNDVCRGDYILVSKKHRRCGAGRALFSAYVEWCRKQNISNAYLWPDGESPARIYEEGGYRFVELRTAGRAVCETKSVQK